MNKPLAVGSIIGADILNVLFVAGASASVTAGGLEAPVLFFKRLFPAMMSTLIIFKIGIDFSDGVFKKKFSVMLLMKISALNSEWRVKQFLQFT